MAYPYHWAASPDCGAIRILRLEPGKDDDPLHGTLEEGLWVTGFSASYDALSYCWGTDVKDHILYTPEGTISITVSLSQALRNIRDNDEAMYLWVDAICINQDNAEEKESTVQYMGQVYARARTVIVYLGEPDEHEYRGIELLEAYTAMYFVANGLEDPAARQRASTINPQTDWKPLRAIYSRPWFRRAWVAQEFIHAREIVVVLGTWRGSWESLWLPMRFGGKELPESGSESISRKVVFATVQTRDISREYMEFKKGSDLFLSLGLIKMNRNRKGGFVTTPPDVEDYNGHKTRMLFGALIAMRGREAKDPRDSIYAFISLIYPQEFLPWLTNIFPISYSMSATEVTRKYGYIMLEELHGDVLYSAGLSQQQRATSEWPTWVPDWSVPNHRGHRFWCSEAADLGRYNDAKDHEFHSMLADDNGDLVVHGNVVDQVKYVGTFNEWATYSNINEALLAFYIDCVSVLNESSSHQLFEQAITKGVLGRVVMANSMKDGTEPSSALTMAFSMFITALSFRLGGEPIPEAWRDSQESSMHLGAVDDSASTNMQSRLLCITESDRLGLTAYGTKPGDVVAVVMGCNVPLVLRTIEHVASNDSSGPFWLVGEAYVHGIMDGEAVESPTFVPDELRIR